MDESQQTDSASPEKRWQPLTAIQRRIAGVLIEKAKTVPETYPMTLNGIVTACNQKSNRSPKMELCDWEVEQSLDEMRLLGAVVEVHGGGRVPKYKHVLYEWFDVDKVEIAVMAELLLRGEQTLGELRSRVARMEDLPDLAHLQPLVGNLMRRGLVQSLTPAGRGQVVSHNLYEQDELSALGARHSPAGTGGGMAQSAETTLDVSVPSDLQQLTRVVEELKKRVEVLEQKMSLGSIEAKDA